MAAVRRRFVGVLRDEQHARRRVAQQLLAVAAVRSRRCRARASTPAAARSAAGTRAARPARWPAPRPARSQRARARRWARRCCRRRPPPLRRRPPRVEAAVRSRPRRGSAPPPTPPCARTALPPRRRTPRVRATPSSSRTSRGVNARSAAPSVATSRRAISRDSDGTGGRVRDVMTTCRFSGARSSTIAERLHDWRRTPRPCGRRRARARRTRPGPRCALTMTVPTVRGCQKRSSPSSTAASNRAPDGVGERARERRQVGVPGVEREPDRREVRRLEPVDARASSCRTRRAPR